MFSLKTNKIDHSFFSKNFFTPKKIHSKKALFSVFPLFDFTFFYFYETFKFVTKKFEISKEN